MRIDLLEKYNIKAPRYTSYPTVPSWDTIPPKMEEWMSEVDSALEKNREISLYIHLPFCERMCTFCGCNKHITKNHAVETPYIKAVLAEWEIYRKRVKDKYFAREIHLGGGSPTFFHPDSLEMLMKAILETVEIPQQHSFGFEAHPNTCKVEHLERLYELGFRRVSIGVQDFDEEILKVINRHQTYDSIERLTLKAKELGYDSINYDLVYGLPFQTQSNIIDNIAKIRQLKPDRIALYSYAHVPWVKPSQRAYSENDLPLGTEKRALYDTAKELLLEIGYKEIGMDHFALESDDLYKAVVAKKLHRNFMGYTPFKTDLLIGLGASSISETGTAFIQNEKKVKDYQSIVASGELAIIRGHLMTQEDEIIRHHILNLIRKQETDWIDSKWYHTSLLSAMERLEEMEADGLVELETQRIIITEKGKDFIRNICLALDARYWATENSRSLFSQTV